MEVGAVKQDFNNEIIHLKKSLNQAKIQIIHKLTRKAKTFTEKKAPEKLKEKLKRKAESAIREVLLIKKIKARDIAKFSIIHQGELDVYLNKPKVDNDKACARLLLHKALQEKYKAIRTRFLNVPIRDLFMSRQERRKLKKEFKDKEKEKRKAKELKKKNKESEWKVEDVGIQKEEDADQVTAKLDNDDSINNEVSEDESMDQEAESGSENSDAETDDMNSSHSGNESESEKDGEDLQNEEIIKEKDSFKVVDTFKETNKEKNGSLVHDVKKIDNDNSQEFLLPPKVVLKKSDKKPKNNTKNKNFEDKINKRKFKKQEDCPTQQMKIVDPFFITSSGENYMSLAEPRLPDEVKEVHRQGNRQLRRAVMFGHVPKSRLRNDHRGNNKYNNGKYNNESKFNNDNYGNKFEKPNGFHKSGIDANNKNKWTNDSKKDHIKNGFKDKKFKRDDNIQNNVEDAKPEKLHPSWEAKKRQSGSLPFQGKKIVFD